MAKFVNSMKRIHGRVQALKVSLLPRKDYYGNPYNVTVVVDGQTLTSNTFGPGMILLNQHGKPMEVQVGDTVTLDRYPNSQYIALGKSRVQYLEPKVAPVAEVKAYTKRSYRKPNLNPVTIKTIKGLSQQGLTYAEIALSFGVSITTVFRAVKGQ